MFKRVSMAVVLLLVIIITSAYAAAPYLLTRYLPDHLQTLGVVHSAFDVGRPGLHSISLPRILLQLNDIHIVASDVVLSYHFAGLLSGRADKISIRHLEIVLPASSAATDGNAYFSPWGLLPVDRISVLDLTLKNTTPAAVLSGQFSMSPISAEAALLMSSHMLPTDLAIAAHLLRSGKTSIEITSPNSVQNAAPKSAPILSLQGEPMGAGLVSFNGNLEIDGPALDFALRLAGVVHPADAIRGTISGTFSGQSAWPLRSQAAISGAGHFDVDLNGNMASASGLGYRGQVDLSIGADAWQVSASESALAISGIELAGNQYTFADSSIELVYDLSVPVTEGVPDFQAIAGKAELDLAIILPGQARLFDLPVLYDAKLTGAVVARLDDVLHVTSGKLVMGASGFSHSNIRYQFDGSVETEFDLKIPRAGLNDPLRELNGNIGANIVSTMLSSAEGALFQQLGLDVGLQLSVAERRYEANIASGSTVSIKAGKVDIGLEAVKPVDLAGRADGVLSGTDFTLAARFSLPITELQTLEYTRARLNIDSFDLGDTHIDAKGRFLADSSSRALPLAFDVKENRADSTGYFEIKADHVLSRPLLKSELPGWTSAYDLTGGHINLALSGNFDLSGETQFSANGDLAIHDGVARYGDVLLGGINTRLPVQIGLDVFTAGPGPIRVGSIDAGLPATDITFLFEADTALAKLSDVTAKVLAASITVDQILYDIANASARFGVKVEGLPIANVLALEGEDVIGDGVLDGQLPVVLNVEGPAVAGGRFSARPPGGYLRYLGDLPATSMSLDLAIRALRNFVYTGMVVTVDYAPDGVLSALVNLKGNSPDVENGRPINFNMNITENIPALLESIRASEGMESRVQQRLSE